MKLLTFVWVKVTAQKELSEPHLIGLAFLKNSAAAAIYSSKNPRTDVFIQNDDDVD